MNITIASDKNSWMHDYLPHFIEQVRLHHHKVLLVHTVRDIPAGDVAFLLSFGQIVPAATLAQHKNNIVVHASELPKGRGWSPLTWQIVEGKNTIPLTLFEAAESVDSGKVYMRSAVHYNGTELIDELRRIMAEKILTMCYEFIERYPAILADAQVQEGEPTFYAKRNKETSRLDPDKTLREQFNLLRTVDNKRYPAFFDLHGHRYILTIEHDKQYVPHQENI